jgi:RimJ/RimL family protein N-acetyltransferase
MFQNNLLQGRTVRLAALSKADLAVMEIWWSDAEFLRLYDATPAFPRSQEQLAKRVEEGQKGESTFLFGIRPLSSDTLIGLFELDGVAWSHGTSFVSIAIGDSNNRGRGYGREAAELGIGFAFHELNLHRLCLTVFSYNKPAIALYERLGFAREGIFREHILRDSHRFDMLLYGLLRREWEARRDGSSPV